MKRTYLLAVRNNDEYKTFSASQKITCELYGIMNDGTKVWIDKNGKQYFCFRLLGTFYFCAL